MAAADSSVLPTQYELFRDSTSRMVRTTKTIGQVLTRQELRAWILTVHQGISNIEAGVQMGIHASSVAHLLMSARDRIDRHYGTVIDKPIYTAQQTIDAGIRAGIRCKQCHMMLPCRQDGEDGPCDGRDVGTDHLDRYLELISYVFGNKFVERNAELERPHD